jgi:hypothetical protein
MREIIKKEWCEIEADWRRLFNNNGSATPFQSYDFLTFTGKGKLYRTDLFRLVGLKELNLVLYKDSEPIAIAALLFKKKKEKHLCYMRGHFTAANYLDFVYQPDLCSEDFCFLMDGIRDALGDVSFQFDRIPEESLTCHYMKQYFASDRIDPCESAYIPLTQSYESWLSGLHKSVRQSMNNHRNRIVRDQVNRSAVYYWGPTIDQEIYKKAMLVCADRFMVKNRFRFGLLSTLARKALAVLLMKEKLTQWVSRSDNSFTAILYMNDEIAAFANALVCKDKRLSGVRFAISSKYAKYSPGGLLISSMVKHLIDLNQQGAIQIDRLDMGQNVSGGSSYKYSYGGVTSHMYHFMS